MIYYMTCSSCDAHVVTDPWYDDWILYVLEHIDSNKHRRIPWNVVFI